MDLNWNRLADEETIAAVSKAMQQKGFDVSIAANGKEAKRIVLGMIPVGSDVMEASSTTLNQIGVTEEIDGSGKYRSLRKEITMESDTAARDALRKRALGANYGIGSVQAVTRAGEMVVASASGSQVALYAYGAANLILVVGSNKIVENLDQAFRRVREHSFLLENERANKAYGQGSSINKLLIIEKEKPGRIRVIIVKEALGY